MSTPSTYNHDIDPYGYKPSLALAIIFLIIFSASTLAHTIQAFMRRSPKWMIVMTIGGLMEILGWSGRLWSRYNRAGSGWIMQTCVLIIGPTFYSAALYMLLGSIIGLVDTRASWLSPKWFKIIFIVADVFSIVLQGVGGGIAGSSDDNSGIESGTHIMLAGIVIQLVVMLFYVAYGLAWGARSKQSLRTVQGSRGINMLLFGMLVASIAIIVRGVYRTVELSQSFSGSIALNQKLFLLDAIPVSIATIALNIWHPSRLLPDPTFVSESNGKNGDLEKTGDPAMHQNGPRRSWFASKNRHGSEETVV